MGKETGGKKMEDTWKGGFPDLQSFVHFICFMILPYLVEFLDGFMFGLLAFVFGGTLYEDPHSLKSNEMAQCSFQPQQPLVCDTFKNCEGLSRVAFMDGNGVVMLGKVVSCERKGEDDKGGKKK